MPSSWNRSRATAITATLLLHLALAAWLLSQKQGTPPAAVEIAEIEWIPPREPYPPPPAEIDFYGDARAVAGALRGSPGRRGFEAAGESERKLNSKPDGPPPLFKQPLPRVGTSVMTAEGETILWVSDYCNISLSSTSLTMKDFHDARKGVRTCIIPIGKRKPRDRKSVV